MHRQVEDPCLVVSSRSKPQERRSSEELPQLWQPREHDVERAVRRVRYEEWIEERAAAKVPPLELEIRRSQAMLALPENWDDSDARPIQRSTWDRAITCLRRLVSYCSGGIGGAVPVPVISPCADGSIDIFWRRTEFQLLVNIPSDPTHSSEFYGETRTGMKLKGSFNPVLHHLSILDSFIRNS